MKADMSEEQNAFEAGLRITTGTYEEGLAMVGSAAPPRVGALDVSEALIQLFCATIEDANPSYWDRDFAFARWGGIIAPPAMLMTWVSNLFWSPGAGLLGEAPLRPMVLRVPLPGSDIINSRQMADIVRPVKVGERLVAHEWLESISKEKRTHLGMGHFVTIAYDVKTLSGETVARVRNIALRYSRWHRNQLTD